MTLLEPEFAHAETEAQPQFPGPNDNAADQWAERGNFWIEDAAKRSRKRRKRERNSSPLILCGHGVSLRIEQGALVIRDGFSHHPQERASHRYFRGDLALPPRILLLDGSGTLSFDVLSWLAEQGVALARVSWSGEVAAVASGSGYSADRKKVRWQLETRDDERRRLAYAADLIRRKLANSIITLERCFAPSKAVTLAVAKATEGMDRLLTVPKDMGAMRSIEGESAALYFAAWNALDVQWTGTNRRPIPDHWRSYTSRSSIASGVKARNRHASHPVNAMLNYAYTVKLAQLQIQAVADGYDPLLGIMHHERKDTPAFILDLIEPERPRLDAAILAIIQSRSFCGADFVISPEGVCRLSPQLARAVASLVANGS